MVATPTFAKESIEDLWRVAGHPRLVGCKMHPDYHGYDAASLDTHRFIEQVARYVKVVLFHSSCMPLTSLATADKLLALAAGHPDMDFILAHAAGLSLSPMYPHHINYCQSVEKVVESGLRNVYIDIANGTIGMPTALETVVAMLGADHVLFATDFPICSRSAIRRQVQFVQDADLADEQREQILSGNARRLLAKAGVTV
jgi:predicted TIM-barrel fold metal-dependent hydrolase